MFDLAASALQAPPPVRVLGAIWIFLICASGLVAIIARKQATAFAEELKDRTLTWWSIIAVLTLVVLLGTKAAILFIAALSFLAFREFHSVVPMRRADRIVLALAYLAIPIQYSFVWTQGYGMFAIFVPVYAFAILSASTVVVGQTQGFIRSNATLHWALMLTVYNISHLAFLTVLPMVHEAPAGGLGLLLFVLIIVQFNDVAQFAWDACLDARASSRKSAQARHGKVSSVGR